MGIICGTDFSTGAVQAGRAAAALSVRLQVPLTLIHVIDELGAELSVGHEHDALYDPLREELAKQAEALRRAYSADVRAAIFPGIAVREVVSAAAQLRAELVVVSSEGAEKQNRWLLGSVAARIALSSHAPVLVVRESSSIEAWAAGQRALRVLVGIDPEGTSRAALKWASNLRYMDPCNLTVVELLTSGVEQQAPFAKARLERELSESSRDETGDGTTTVVVRALKGSVEAALNAIAVEFEADLLVVGAHQRQLAERLWRPSVSRAVLKHAALNIACVPCPSGVAVRMMTRAGSMGRR